METHNGDVQSLCRVSFTNRTQKCLTRTRDLVLLKLVANETTAGESAVCVGAELGALARCLAFVHICKQVNTSYREGRLQTIYNTCDIWIFNSIAYLCVDNVPVQFCPSGMRVYPWLQKQKAVPVALTEQP